jgi:hypothetical protein
LLLNPVSFKMCTQFYTKFFIFHISIRIFRPRIKSNRISKGLLYVLFFFFLAFKIHRRS